MDASRNVSRKGLASSVFVYAAATIPFLLSIVFHTIRHPPRQPPQTPIRPALSFDQYLVHLGNVPLRQSYSARFRFTNRSDRKVTVRELKPSCGCLNPKLKTDVFKPGEEGEFYLTLQTATEQPGPNEYYCDVQYDDGQLRSTRVVLKLNLPEQTVVVRPPALIFIQQTDEVTTHSISVIDFRPQRLELVGVDCSSQLAQVALGNTEFDTEGNRVHKVLVRVGAVPAGRHQAVITIHTDDPEFTKLQVPLRIEGPVNPVEHGLDPPHRHSRQ